MVYGKFSPGADALIPLEQVFTANEGNTYYAFIEKEENHLC